MYIGGILQKCTKQLDFLDTFRSSRYFNSYLPLTDVEYTWILRQGKIVLLTWNSFIGQFVHPLGGERFGNEGERENCFFSPLRVSLY